MLLEVAQRSFRYIAKALAMKTESAGVRMKSAGSDLLLHISREDRDHEFGCGCVLRYDRIPDVVALLDHGSHRHPNLWPHMQMREDRVALVKRFERQIDRFHVVSLPQPDR